jgi:phosphoesterase RecJ-like protein
MEEKFQQLVIQAGTILVTSHLSPDQDAICSALLLGETLRTNFPDKKVVVTLEDPSVYKLDFVADYSSISFGNLLATLEMVKPDLMIITDTDNYDRVSRNDGAKIRDLATNTGMKLVVIDHHELSKVDKIDVLINEGSAAAVQEAFRTCFTRLKLKRPEGYAQTTMVGILSDTDRFKYYYPHYSETFAIAGELVEQGVDIQKLDAQLRRFTPDEIRVMGHLAANITVRDGYSFAYISDAFAQEWLKEARPVADFKSGRANFGDQFIRNVGDNLWGFTLYQDLSEPGTYRVSFRSTRGVRDVAKLAQSLGGGGHAESAAAQVEAKNVEQALQAIEKAIAAQ